MASLNSVSITFEFEPIVKVFCKAFDCQNNLINVGIDKDRMAACNLKHITIGKGANCLSYKPLENKKDAH